MFAVMHDSEPGTVSVQIYQSDIFNGREGQGSFDPWDAQLKSSVSGMTFEIQVPISATCRDVQNHLAAVVKVADTPEQCLLWAVDLSIDDGVRGTPHLQRKYGDFQLFQAEGGDGLDPQRLWLHIVTPSKSGTCSDRTRLMQGEQNQHLHLPQHNSSRRTLKKARRWSLQ